MSQILKAVDLLHCEGFIHKDLKWENILVDKFGYIKLADFGYAMKGRSAALRKSDRYRLAKMIHSLTLLKDESADQTDDHLEREKRRLMDLRKQIWNENKPMTNDIFDGKNVITHECL